MTPVRKAISVAIASAAVSILPLPTMAQNPYPCSKALLSTFNNKLDDGHLYYFRGSKWTEIQSANYQLLPPGQYDFVYVINESLPLGRAGVLVIKSGRYQNPTRSAEEAKSVRLIRDESRFTKTRMTCPRAVAKFNSGGEPVSARAYDGYHDYGYQADPASADMDTIRRFHVAYENASRQCVETDRATPDFTIPGFFRSNRSQFSFDDTIVERGMGWQIADAGRSLIGRSYAAYGKFAERQVKIRRYEAEGQQPACVHLNVSLAGPNHFLSVNDLENWSSGIRGPENRWNHQ
jgi:hypothetical protein